MSQNVASVLGTRGIDRFVAFLDVLNYSILVDHECGAVAKALIFPINAVVFHDAALFEVTE